MVDTDLWALESQRPEHKNFKVLPVEPWLHRPPGDIEFQSSPGSVIAVGLQPAETAAFHVTL